jgi:hypothetical protein
MTFTICLLLFLWKRVVVVDVGRKKALGSGYGIRGVHCFGGLACIGVGGAGWMEKRTLRSWATPLICANHINLGPYWRVWRNRRWASDWGIWACFRIPIVEQKPVTYPATKKRNVIVVIRFRTALHPRRNRQPRPSLSRGNHHPIAPCPLRPRGTRSSGPIPMPLPTHLLSNNVLKSTFPPPWRASAHSGWIPP